MPVIGLPTAVETTLSALLTGNSLSSWKIVGEGENTVVVLRPKPVDSVTSMADPVQNSTQSQHSRRKSPCEIRRDQERARQHKSVREVGKSVTVTDSDNASVLRQSNNPTRVTELEQTTTQEKEGVSRASGCVDTRRSAVSEASPVPDSSLHHPHVNKDNSIIFENKVGGFEPRVVKDYVARLKTGMTRRRLRDSERNKKFRKTVVCCSDDNVIQCESDDIVVHYSCHPTSDSDCLYWYIKQDEKHMLEQEWANYWKLRKEGKPTDSTLHGETLARAERGMDTLRRLLLFYLG